MTNTRLTDPEVLEFRYPVLLEDFHIRAGSGGRGRWKAGDGVMRTIRFLERMDCTILSAIGACGRSAQRRRSRSGRREFRAAPGWTRGKLQGCDATALEEGEAIIIRTPTAGVTAPLRRRHHHETFRARPIVRQLFRSGGSRRSGGDRSSLHQLAPALVQHARALELGARRLDLRPAGAISRRHCAMIGLAISVGDSWFADSWFANS